MFILGLDEFLNRALTEDIGTGDITTMSCVSPAAVSKGAFKAKEAGVICGIDILIRVFALVDATVTV